MYFSTSNYDDLMERYLDVCNQALALNKERFPFKQIWGAAQESECGKVIEVNIADGFSKASYTMRFSKGRLVAEPHSKCQYDRKWTVSEHYLENVAKDPEEYIQNPAKIDWEWMYDAPAQ